MPYRDVVTPYQHRVTEWTIGDLAKYLGVPDDIELSVPRDAPVRVSTLQAPSTNVGRGGDVEDQQFVLTGAGVPDAWVPPTYGKDRTDGRFEPGKTVVLYTDFQSGEYENTERDVWVEEN